MKLILRGTIEDINMRSGLASIWDRDNVMDHHNNISALRKKVVHFQNCHQQRQ